MLITLKVKGLNTWSLRVVLDWPILLEFFSRRINEHLEKFQTFIVSFVILLLSEHDLKTTSELSVALWLNTRGWNPICLGIKDSLRLSYTNESAQIPFPNAVFVLTLVSIFFYFPL